MTRTKPQPAKGWDLEAVLLIVSAFVTPSFWFWLIQAIG